MVTLGKTRFLRLSNPAGRATQLLPPQSFLRQVTVTVPAAGGALASTEITAAANGMPVRDTTTTFWLARDTALWYFSGTADEVGVIETPIETPVLNGGSR